MPNHRRVWSIVADGCVFGAKGALIMKLLGTNTHTQRGPHLFFGEVIWINTKMSVLVTSSTVV